jgi:hypothetical protein
VDERRKFHAKPQRRNGAPEVNSILHLLLYLRLCVTFVALREKLSRAAQ